MEKHQETPNELIDSIHLNNKIANQIDDNGAKCLGEGIAKCVTLTSLKLLLSNNRIGLSGAKYLGEGIARCVTLTSLNLSLSYNNIG